MTTIVRRPAPPPPPDALPAPLFVARPEMRPADARPLTYDRQSVRRDGDLDLEFTGALLASAHYSADGDRFTEVDLFVTEGGRYIACVRFGSSTRATMRHDACVCATPAEVLAWMRGDRGKIGAASKLVLERANTYYPDLFPMRPVTFVA